MKYEGWGEVWNQEITPENLEALTVNQHRIRRSLRVCDSKCRKGTEMEAEL